MAKSVLPLLAVPLLVVVIAFANQPEQKNPGVNPKDTGASETKAINDILENSLTKHDRNTIEKILSFTQEQVGQYALLIMIEFYDDLSPDKLAAMRERSPEEWKVFESYINKAFAWLAITKRADEFLENHLEKTLKEELGESQDDLSTLNTIKRNNHES